MTVRSGKSVDDIEEAAARWAARLDAAPDTAHPELDGWLAEKPAHAGALLRAQAALDLFAPEAAKKEREEGAGDKPVWRRAAWAGGALALAASIAVILLPAGSVEHYASEIGEVRSVALSDGSSMTLGTESRVEIAFASGERELLLQDGKALFRVAHVQDRPFRVVVDDFVITDIGTAFQVDHEDATGMIEVLVTEGAVQVDGPGTQLQLRAGDKWRLVSNGSQRIALRERLDKADIDRALAWRVGRIELEGEPLDRAIAEFNRHNRVRLRLSDPALGRQKLHGSFRLDDPHGFADAVGVSLDTRVKQSDDDLVIGP